MRATKTATLVVVLIATAAPAGAGQADALLTEAQQLLASGSADQAAAKLKEAIASDPNHWQSRCALGGILAQASRLEEAEAELTAAVAIHDDAACMGRLAQVLLVAGKLDKAEQVLRRAAAQPGAGESVLYNLARLLDRSDRPDEAVEVWQRYAGMATDPARLATARTRSGRLLVLLGRPLDAVSWFRAALDADPNNNGLRAELAAALMQTSRLDEAWAEYEILIAAGAADAAALSNAGSICQLRRDLPRAVELLSKSVAMDRSSMPTRVALAMAQAQSGQDAAAIETLQAIVTDDPENVKAWFLMGQSFRKLGRMEEARRAMERHEQIHERIMRERMGAR